MAKMKTPPAITVEQEERECISLAVELAKKQMREGTATSQVICHYLDMASPLTKEKARKVKLENDYLEAKIKSIELAETQTKMLEDAFNAFKTYTGQVDEEYTDEEIF